MIFSKAFEMIIELYLTFIKKAILLVTFILVCLSYRCSSDEEKSPFLAIDNPEAQYVGMETCKNCHTGIYESFMQTGMGQSWGVATKQKSSADFSNAKALVYDSIKNLYYKPYWDGDSLCILEYRLTGNDPTHKRIEKVSYIVGSGKASRIHISSILMGIYIKRLLLFIRKKASGI